MFTKFIGAAFLVLAVWQLWATKQTLDNTKKQGNEATSSFLLVSLWSSIVFALAVAVVALITLFGGWS
ncbi:MULTISPECIES: hypothetical protein [Enterococcus]|uniref:hypothetical protein n=1 Tax=Enterococcus TaxID=1350 RepID=UPI0010F9DB4B|nr:MULTISPECIES: hypothetical protein [Enterococcus]KAF1300560.1 hypothetical protein BAU16_12215 [Enterococcus sp. JM9B]